MDLSSVQDQIHEQAKGQLRDFSATLEIPEERQHLVFGRPEAEIHRVAEEVGSDLIVVGSTVVTASLCSWAPPPTASSMAHAATCSPSAWVKSRTKCPLPFATGGRGWRCCWAAS